MRRRGLAASLLVVLSGCSHSSLVLLPDEGGGHGQVAILESGGQAGETVVNEANSRTSLGSRQPAIRPLGAHGLKPEEALLLNQMPPAAKSFTLYFLEATTTLTPESAPALDELHAEIAKRPGAEVQVTGYTDTVGSEVDNDALSQGRAEEILNLLVTKGFDRSIMSAVGRGERDLKETTGDGVSSAINRRVEVVVR
jgi:outer membrane protein OmpA-like peptidoglycan-associated protein